MDGKMVCCGKVLLGEQQTLPTVERSPSSICAITVKKAALLAVSLFAVFTAGSLAVLSGLMLFSGTASFLPYLLIFAAALFGFVCASIVLVKCLSSVVQDVKKKEKAPESISMSDLSSSSSSSELEKLIDSSSSLGSILCSIGDSVDEAFGSRNNELRAMRARANSC
jgi:hypothetical protein